MMKCKEYIFRLTSGQLENAGAMERFWATQHRLMCRSCRAFSANDARLSKALAAYRDHLQAPSDK